MAPFPITDLHAHLIPGVDDGARDAAEARAALEVLAEEGVAHVVATPHFHASALPDGPGRERRLGELDMGWRLLEKARQEVGEGAPRLSRGTEVLLDAPDPDLSDPRLRLAGGPAVLVEFPFLRIPLYGARQLEALASEGWTPVVAHVERYAGLERALSQVAVWRGGGAILQVNAASLLGGYGPEARRRAWHLLGRGWVGLLASDWHARGEGPRLAETVEMLLERARPAGGEDGGGGGRREEVRRALLLLLEENPRRVLEGRRALPVPALAPRPAWRRWLGRG
ncbi:MAG TPA: CpsB/CapC family capsule biosynthesis tyrosine phosphatase [Gemmatimonadota bacterium]|nr:CpsB/CapC family capsule biosynthesis tyrosine phosphatase [Gemmatimonadota bacterium]